MSKKFYSRSGSRIIKRTARVEHECVECGRIIEIGETYREISYIGDDDGFHTVRVCGECFQS